MKLLLSFNKPFVKYYHNHLLLSAYGLQPTLKLYYKPAFTGLG